MQSVIIATVVLVLAATAAAFQARPDFSGQWSADGDNATPTAPAPGRPPVPARGDMGSGWGSTLTIKQDGKQLALEYVVFNLLSDPKEDTDLKDANPWAQLLMDRIIDEFNASVKRYPHVPPNAPDPYQPPKSN